MENQTKPPLFPEFKPLSLEDRDIIKAYFEKYPSGACEMSVPNLFIWRNFEKPVYTLLHDNLCIHCSPPSEPAYFLPPVGENNIERTIDICLSFAPRLSRVPEAFVEKFCRGYALEEDRNNFDYVYLSSDLIELKGKKYDGKRNRLKKIEKYRPFNYVKLSSRHMADCLHLLEDWLEKKSSVDRILRAQKEAIIEALTHFEALGLKGGGVEIDGKIAAFTIGDKLSDDTAVIHIEIVSPGYPGLSQLINREFIKNEWGMFKFINREQDLGLPGLRRAKLSYYPHHLVKKYNVWK